MLITELADHAKWQMVSVCAASHSTITYVVTPVLSTLRKSLPSTNARTLSWSPARTLSIALLLAGMLAWAGCDSGNSGMDQEPVPDQISYELGPQNNSGVTGTVTFWRAGPDTTLVTLDLDEEAIVAEVSHPAHIHNNSAADGGDIEFHLSAVNGSGPGTSARKIGRPIEFFADFNGHVNVHESPAALETVVAQADIGANAEGTDGQGLDFVNSPRAKTYSLNASTTEGSVLSDGITGTVRFEELTGSQTLVTYSLETGGSVNDYVGSDVTVAQIGHIHQGSLENGPGSISNSDDDGFSGYLGSVDPTDPAARSSRIVNESYDELTGYDGYVNIHESNANSQFVFAQGNIGANAGNQSSGDADVTITVNNVGTNAWEVTDVSGAGGVASTGTDNPTLTLTVDTRYRIVNDGGASAHPFALRDGNDEYLMRQEDGSSGRLEDDAEIDYVEDDAGVTFTYTQTLASAASTYRCTLHPSMEGSVETDGGGGGGGSY